MGQIKTIQLSEILNHNENPRHEIGNNQSDTLKRLFNTVGYQNMLNLAEDIQKNGLLGNQQVVVVYSEKLKKYIAYDGNRRIAALKLLKNYEEYTFLDQVLRDKAKKIAQGKEILGSISCYVTDEEEAHHIMERLHSGEDKGRGLKQWGPKEKDIFNARKNGIKPMSHLIDIYVRKYFSELDINSILPHTTIQRIFNTRDIKKEIGLNTDNEDTFTLERIKLVIDACEFIKQTGRDKGLAVTRIFNTANDIEKNLLPWIKEYKTQSHSQERRSTYLNDEKSTPIKFDFQEYNYGGDLKKTLNDSSNLSKQSNKNESESENIKATTNQRHQDLVDDKINNNITLPNQLNSRQEEIPYIEGTGGNSNLPYFFQGLKFGHLSSNDSDAHGVFAICNELKMFSDKKMVNKYPIASAFLTRAIIEQSIKYYSKKTLIQGGSKLIWDQVGQYDKLSKIIDSYKKCLSNYITDSEYRSYFIRLFDNYDNTIEPLNWVVHRPEKFQISPEKLIELPKSGLLSLINYFLSK